jgi:hypothetical protein
MTAAASIKVEGRPAARAVHLAKCVKREVDFVGLTTLPPKVLKSCGSRRPAAPGIFPETKSRRPSILE